MEESYEIVCSPESKPILQLEELLNWKSAQIPIDSKSYSLCRLETPKTSSKRGFKTLLCHDMKGGYLDDRFNDGCGNELAYRFFFWSSIDIFVYFSHNFITIPPMAWINASHRNRVPILGTFIVEGWAQTKLICNQILNCSETIEKVVSKLVEIAKFYHFDGWLINIECEINPNCIESLVYFVKLLTDMMHSHDPHSLVIWYDSVISPEGCLKWQNELNSSNKCFFDVCDGIFLNYTWNETNLKASHQISANISRNYDVFVGIDVFGRNCFGGGGMNTNLAVKEALKYELSIAIFANAWTHEVLGADNFTSNEYQFWSTLDLGVHHWTQTLPICSSFCQGFGLKLYKSGKILSEKSWHNLNVQELQPTYHKWVEICLEDGFNGGGSLKLNNKSVPLFRCEVSIKRSFYAITYKSNSNQKLGSIFKYQTNDENTTFNLFNNDLGLEENIDFKIENIKFDKDFKQELQKFNKYGIFETNNGWVTEAWIIETKSPKTQFIVNSIELSILNVSEDKVPDVLIGQFIFDTI